MAAGDIACDPTDPGFNGSFGTDRACRQMATSELLLNGSPDAVLALGDNQYDSGLLSAYQASYDPSWGRVRPITRPVPGNHEYQTADAAGYYTYFGELAGDPSKGYYSFDLGTWHLVALNSNCASVGGCERGSSQEQWLRADLAAHPAECVLAYWHHPRFSSGNHGSDPATQPLWADLYAAGADVVLAGHDHDYERFAPQDPYGTLDVSHGIREFVVGTGGKSEYAFSTVQPNSEVRQSDAAGVLELTLEAGSYAWRFVPVAGESFEDWGQEACETPQTDNLPPSPPSGLAATTASSTQVDLEWAAAVDENGIALYEISRNGVVLTTVGPQTTYSDTQVFGGTSYTYTVRARDGAGNWSPSSNEALATTAPEAASPPVFSDGFEAGSFVDWSATNAMTVQSGDSYTGAFAARATSTTSASYAYKQLGATYPELYGRLRFKVLSQGSNPTTLLKLRNASGSSIVAVYRASNGLLSLRNDAGAITTYSDTTITTGVWHEVQLRARVESNGGETEVWYDGVRVASLSLSQPLGTSAIGRVQIGETTAGRTYDVLFDDVAVGSTYITP